MIQALSGTDMKKHQVNEGPRRFFREKNHLIKFMRRQERLWWHRPISVIYNRHSLILFQITTTNFLYPRVWRAHSMFSHTFPREPGYKFLFSSLLNTYGGHILLTYKHVFQIFFSIPLLIFKKHTVLFNFLNRSYRKSFLLLHVYFWYNIHLIPLLLHVPG